MLTTDRSLSNADIRKFRTLTIFTTGQIAKVCKVSSRTVSKWIDDESGDFFLPSEKFRLPSGSLDKQSTDRRVTREGLTRFLTAKGMFPHLAVLQGLSRILYAGCDRALCQGALGGAFDVIPADCSFDLARLIKRDMPSVVIVDFGKPGNSLDPRVACADIRKHFGVVSAGGPQIFGLRVRDSRDQEFVDDSVMAFDNFPAKIRALMPLAGNRLAS